MPTRPRRAVVDSELDRLGIADKAATTDVSKLLKAERNLKSQQASELPPAPKKAKITSEFNADLDDREDLDDDFEVEVELDLEDIDVVDASKKKAKSKPRVIKTKTSKKAKD